jgi:hypothetical protein
MKKEYYTPDMSGVITDVPSDYARQVSKFQPVVFDGEVPIGWGFRCIGPTMTTERWEAFPGDRVCVDIKDAPEAYVSSVYGPM